MTYLSDIFPDISFDILSDISFDILSDLSSHILPDISFDILSDISFDISFDIPSDISSDILSDIFLTYLSTFFLTYLLTYLSDISSDVTFERDAERFKAKAEETAKTSQRGQDAGRKTSGPMPTVKEDETSRGRQRACLEDELGSNNWRRTFWSRISSYQQSYGGCAKLDGGTAEGT